MNTAKGQNSFSCPILADDRLGSQLERRHRRRDFRVEPVERHRSDDVAFRIGDQAIARQIAEQGRQRRLVEFGQMSVQLGESVRRRQIAGDLENVVAVGEDHAVGRSDGQLVILSSRAPGGRLDSNIAMAPVESRKRHAVEWKCF